VNQQMIEELNRLISEPLIQWICEPV